MRTLVFHGLFRGQVDTVGKVMLSPMC